MNWKRKLKRIPVTGAIVSIVLTLISCCNQKYVPQERIKIVPIHKIDTCLDVKSDTILWLETDTLKVEAIVKDTMLRLRVETKPIIVRDTINSSGETEKVKKKAKKEEKKAKKNKEKAKENPKKTKIFVFFSLCFLVFWLIIKFNKKR
jgi:hypothetical protein